MMEKFGCFVLFVLQISMPIFYSSRFCATVAIEYPGSAVIDHISTV